MTLSQQSLLPIFSKSFQRLLPVLNFFNNCFWRLRVAWLPKTDLKGSHWQFILWRVFERPWRWLLSSRTVELEFLKCKARQTYSTLLHPLSQLNRPFYQQTIHKSKKEGTKSFSRKNLNLWQNTHRRSCRRSCKFFKFVLILFFPNFPFFFSHAQHIHITVKLTDGKLFSILSLSVCLHS